MRIAVLMGGNSEERDVSLASGAEVARALREAGHHVVAVDTTRGALERADEEKILSSGVGRLPRSAPEQRDFLDTGDTRTLTRHPDVGDAEIFFLALHGGAGEDGTVQTLLDVAGIPYVGSGRVGSALAMDKDLSKRLFRDAGIPTPDWITGDVEPDAVVERLGLPVIVKPAAGGSSLRLTLAHDMDELRDAADEARGGDDLVLFEAYVTGREFTVGILGEEPLPVGEIIPEHELFDYECKYQPGMAREIFPADIPDALAGRLQEMAVEVHRLLRLEDFSRVDFLVDDEGEIWTLEANNLPGLTSNSLVPKAAKAAGISFPELADRRAGARPVATPRGARPRPR